MNFFFFISKIDVSCNYLARYIRGDAITCTLVRVRLKLVKKGLAILDSMGTVVSRRNYSTFSVYTERQWETMLPMKGRPTGLLITRL